MTKMVNLVACLVLVLTMAFAASPVVSATQPEGAPFDLANVPLPTNELPEQGYQVLTGGYLDRKLTAHWIASPRNGDTGTVDAMLTETGWVKTYTLDLVLLEDRAWVGSDILSLIQTNVFLFTDDDGAEEAAGALADFSTSDDAVEIDSVIQDASTVRLRSQSGDTYRSVARHERTVIEVVTLESAGVADLGTHRLVIADTIDRLGHMSETPSPGISPQAVLISDGGKVAELFNAQQTGVHQLYRVRDDAVQLAAGELEAPDNQSPVPGLAMLYQSGQAINTGRGNGFYSLWIGEFHSDTDAAAYMSGLPESSDGALLPDPYFMSWADEQTVSQGVTGLYRVSGATVNGAFSGTVEIQQRGPYVVGIGWRTFGDSLPPVDVTSRLMDAQLNCLDDAAPCPSVPLEEILPPESATPVPPAAKSAGMVTSDEFGWSLSFDPDEWTINEQFAESGYDFIELQSGRSLVTLESVIDQHGDPQQCVLDEMHALQEFEEHAVIELGSDDPDEVPAGLELGHGWAIYTVEPLAEERADQEYTIRIDCYTIFEDGASLVVTQRAPRGEWKVEREKGETLRNALNLPLNDANHDIIGTQLTHNWRWTMIDNFWIERAA